MAIERTLAIIKPDAVKSGHAGEIITTIEQHGFRIVAMKQRRLALALASFPPRGGGAGHASRAPPAPPRSAPPEETECEPPFLTSHAGARFPGLCSPQCSGPQAPLDHWVCTPLECASHR